MTVALPDKFDIAATESTDVLIVGSGPAGLSAAAELKRLGVGKVTVIERDVVAGGMPRWCGHSPFGMREFFRILSGPAYCERLAERAAAGGASILLRHTAVSVDAEGGVIVASPDGVKRIDAGRVILATGIREQSRAARLIAGERPPAGIINTGALQYFVFREKQRLPFRNPVIVGTELVSMSAILTLRSAGIRPVGIIEASDRAVARAPFTWLPGIVGLPVHFNSTLVAIEGHPQVTGVVIGNGREMKRIDCDGVVLTGDFTPESSLARMSGLAIDAASGGPVVDTFGRTSDAHVFAAGNVLRGVETAGWCWAEGKALAQAVARDLDDAQRSTSAVTLLRGRNIRHATPQRIATGRGAPAHENIQLRLSRAVRGRLTVEADGRTIWSRALDSRPERRILIPIADVPWPRDAAQIVIHAEEGR